MKRISIILLFSAIWLGSYAQIADRTITTPVPATGPNAGNQSDIYSNIWIKDAFYIPSGTINTLNGGKSRPALRFNTSLGKLMVFNGTTWEVVGDGAGGVTSVFGRTGSITAQSGDYSSFYPLLSSSYNNPTWINTLAYSKITGVPSFITTETDPTVPAYAKSLTGFNVIKPSTDALYEPLFSKNTAFNKNFGTTSGTIAEGNDSRINNGQTAFGWGNHAGLYPTYNGAGATGTWGISITNNAGTATKLQTARTINGISFDGTSDIIIPTGGSGTVTNVSSPDGSIIVANATTTPVLTLPSTINSNTNGNAATVTNGVYTNGGYADPSWLTSLAFSKITGFNSGSVTTALGYTPYNPSTYPVNSGGETLQSVVDRGFTVDGKTADIMRFRPNSNDAGKFGFYYTTGSNISEFYMYNNSSAQTVKIVNNGTSYLNGGGLNVGGSVTASANDGGSTTLVRNADLSNYVDRSTNQTAAGEKIWSGFHEFRAGLSFGDALHSSTLYSLGAGVGINANDGTNSVNLSFPTTKGNGMLALISDIPIVASGSYSPTVTAVANNSGPSVSGFKYSRNGNIVTFSGRAAINVTSASTSTTIAMTLPIASNFTGNDDATGAVTALNAYGQIQMNVLADSTGDSIQLNFFSGATTGSNIFYFTGQYEIK